MESGAHAALMAALWADTAFLAGQGVMDYSLLVGVDRPGRVLVVGIIDFLRQARSGALQASCTVVLILDLAQCWDNRPRRRVSRS